MAKKKYPTAEDIKEQKKNLVEFTKRAMSALSTLEPGKVTYVDLGANDKVATKNNPAVCRQFCVGGNPIVDYWFASSVCRMVGEGDNGFVLGTIAYILCTAFSSEKVMDYQVTLVDKTMHHAVVSNTLRSIAGDAKRPVSVVSAAWDITDITDNQLNACALDPRKRRTLINDIEKAGRKASPYLWSVVMAKQAAKCVHERLPGNVFIFKTRSREDVAMTRAIAYALGAPCTAITTVCGGTVITQDLARGYKMPLVEVDAADEDKLYKQIKKAVRITTRK